jgi:hypothetical protein
MNLQNQVYFSTINVSNFQVDLKFTNIFHMVVLIKYFLVEDKKVWVWTKLNVFHFMNKKIISF